MQWHAFQTYSCGNKTQLLVRHTGRLITYSRPCDLAVCHPNHSPVDDRFVMLDCPQHLPRFIWQTNQWSSQVNSSNNSNFYFNKFILWHFSSWNQYFNSLLFIHIPDRVSSDALTPGGKILPVTPSSDQRVLVPPGDQTAYLQMITAYLHRWNTLWRHIPKI